MKGRWLALCVAVLMGAASYAWWLHLTHGVRALGRASAMVTISDKRADCAVRRVSAKSGDNVPCSEVSAYLRDKLNLGSGTFVGIVVMGKVPPDAETAVSKELTTNSFKVAGVLRVGFITEPQPSGAR